MPPPPPSFTDIVITPGDVVPSAAAGTQVVRFGATVTAGQVLVRDSATGRFVPASNLTADGSGGGIGSSLVFSLSGGVNGQFGAAALAGSNITLGAVLEPSRVYVLSTAGKIVEANGLDVGEFLTIIGYAIDVETLRFSPVSTLVEVPAT
jgi:hypothetical protein